MGVSVFERVMVRGIEAHFSRGMSFQDVAKKGLQFGDESEDAEAEKELEKELGERFKPLIDWLKEETKHIVRDGKRFCDHNIGTAPYYFASSCRFEPPGD